MNDLEMAAKEADDHRQEMAELMELVDNIEEAMSFEELAWEELREFEDTGGDHGEADLMDGE